MASASISNPASFPAFVFLHYLLFSGFSFTLSPPFRILALATRSTAIFKAGYLPVMSRAFFRVTQNIARSVD